MGLGRAFKNGFRAFNQGISEAGRQFVQTLGVSGTQIYSGYITDEDYGNRGLIKTTKDWDDSDQRADMIEEMITDPAVESVRNAVELPIRSAPITVEPAGGRDAKRQDKKIAAALEQDFLRNPNFSISDLMSHMMTALWYGNVVMVKTFERVEDEGMSRTRWKNWAYRKQRTIDRWDSDVFGNLWRVHQLATGIDGRLVDTWIPNERPPSALENPLFHFSYKQLGDNWNGVSLLRQAWQPYFIKRRHILNLAKQGDVAAIGIPVWKWKNGIPDDGSAERNAAQTFLKNLHSLAQNYAEIPDDAELDIFGGDKRFGFDLIPGIRLLNQEITASILASFLEQPKASVGSYAMQDANISWFLDALEGIANEFETILNEGRRGMQHVKQYVNLNFPNVTEYPKIRIAQINTMNLETLMPAVEQYVNSGFPIKPEDINKIRDRLGWSQMEAEEFQEELTQRTRPMPA